MRINKKLLQPTEPKFKGARSELLKKPKTKQKVRRRKGQTSARGESHLAISR